eukprot:TRINITY_DN6644_c0_g2_i1.p2 TRINITY_DN6644_c0_g2~~TRINITY_DN6644_c0_g2_i1.p2  ORF type:complete len:227 (+),score=40.67 TRINITY_DN6644_c0_g2_i1:54-734(+)
MQLQVLDIPERFLFFFLNDPETNEIYTILFVGSVRCVQETDIDALSRAHAHRKINRTLKWFEEAVNNPNSERSSFEFFRYHSGAPFTFPNAFKFLYGHYYTAMEKNMRKSNTGEKYKSFLQIYQEQGFVVGHATDFCSAYSVSNNPEYENIFDFTPNDHENYVQACDLNYEKQNSEWDLTQGPYSPLPRCLYGKNVFEYILEYGEQFLEAYKDEKKVTVYGIYGCS